jgi:hypothetical protein
MIGIANAETRIDQGSLSHDHETWTEAGSPYIIEQTLEIGAEQYLFIGPGVTVIANPNEDGDSDINVHGSLSMSGKDDSRIRFSGSGSINIFGGTTTISNTDLVNTGGLNIFRSYAQISSSTIMGIDNAMRIKSGVVRILNSEISGNKTGIIVEKPQERVFQVRNTDEQYGVGGIGNALDDTVILAQDTSFYPSSDVQISNSVITNNTSSSIENYDFSTVTALDNWWGSASGPAQQGENMIVGDVAYSPWLKNWGKSSECCSSILFIPGLKGTRLYRDQTVLGISSTNKLWEPNRNADVAKLYLDQNGQSLDPKIYAGEAIDKVFGLYSIYGNFLDFMDDMKEGGIISEWQSFGYDWRLPIDDIVLEKVKSSTGTKSLIESISTMASSSKTGKVTIVAHSNGGLIMKYLINQLATKGMDAIVDKTISVAVPYLGTPSAIGSIIHGDGQSILSGLILKKNTARTMAVNMPSAYSLLPSREYFKKVFSPTIVFASTTISSVDFGTDIEDKDTYEEQSDFVVNAGKKISKSNQKNTSLPISGNSILMAAADIIQGILTPYSLPSTISKWAIVGWNKQTEKGLVYSDKVDCVATNCRNTLAHVATTTLMGDGTVVSPSAAYDAGTTISMDLQSTGDVEDTSISHANILESSTTQAVISEIIKGDKTDDSDILDRLDDMTGVSIGEPDYSKQPSFIVLSTHSPVDLHVYDEKGRHTGIVDLPAELDFEDSAFEAAFEENIPGSTFTDIGGTDDDPEYQVYLPDSGGQRYSIGLNGTGVGTFTFKIERVRNGSFVDAVVYKDLPVTPLTIASTTIVTAVSEESLPAPLASSSVALAVDIDGNGSIDLSATEKTDIDQATYLQLLRKTISSMKLNDNKVKNLLKRIDRLESIMKQGKSNRLIRMISKFEKKIGNINHRKMSSNDKNKIIELIGLYIARFE